MQKYAPRADSYEVLDEAMWYAVFTDVPCDHLFEHLWGDERAKIEAEANGGAANREGQVLTSAEFVRSDRHLYLFRHLLDCERALKALDQGDKG